jgi:uncharacterized protein (TIGR03067 family)
MPRTFAAAVLLALLALLPPEKAVAGPPEGASGKMVLDDDVEKLQGSWRVTSVEVGGHHSEDDKEVLLVVKKNILTVKEGDKVVWKATMRLNPAKEPKCIDLEIDEGGKREEAVGIYKIAQNSLTLCFGSGRPKKFPSNKGSSDKVTNLVREKP